MPWLRFLLPNVLLVVAVNALYVDLGYQLAGEEWLPLILCATRRQEQEGEQRQAARKSPWVVFRVLVLSYFHFPKDYRMRANPIVQPPHPSGDRVR